MIGSESLGGALNGWLTNLRAAIPASGSAADQCNPSMISIQDMLLSIINPQLMKAAAGDLGAMLTEFSTVSWAFDELTYSTAATAERCTAFGRQEGGYPEFMMGDAGAQVRL